MLSRILRSIGMLILITAIGFSPTFAQREPTGEDGSYLIYGTTPDGDPYSGALFLTDVIGQEPLMLATGHFNAPYRGIGYLYEGVLGIVYGGPHCSLGMYQLWEDGVRGIWATPALDGVRMQGGAIEAFDEETGALTFDLRSAAGDDKAELGDLVVEDNADTIRLTMTLNGVESVGYGIVARDIMVVAYGDAACGMGAYEMLDAGAFEGSTVAWGSDRAGQERADMPAMGGAYSVSGTNPDGTPYEGTLAVASQSYHHAFTWQIGADTFEGVALLRGGVMGVGWGGETCGVALYNITQAGHLDGDLFFPGYEYQGWETATRNAPVVGDYAESIAGVYTVVERQNPSGERFDNPGIPLTVTPQGDEGHGALYDVRWDFPDGTFMTGTGIYLFNSLTVGYGGDMCGVSAYTVEGDALSGTWAMVGGGAQGTESAQRAA